MITFTNNPLDRAAVRREDAEWLAARREGARVIALDKGRPLMNGDRLAHGQSASPDLFLGLDGETAVFAVETSDAAGGEFQELRAVALTLTPGEAAIVCEAKCLFEWHARHRFCSNCGQATTVVSAGWKRVCPACKAEHFPRVDPVVIMLPTAASAACSGGRASGRRGASRRWRDSSSLGSRSRRRARAR